MRREPSSMVVGAGIGGPVLAMFLQRSGVSCTVVEAREHVAESEGAFLGVAPNGMHVLAELGLAEAVLAIGHPCSAFQFLNGKGASLGGIDRSADGENLGWPLVMVRRGQLHELLSRAARERDVDIRMGTRLVALEEEPSRVRAAFADGTVLGADMLFGCDGLRSTVRALVLPESRAPRFSGLLDYGGFSSAPIPFPAGINVMVFGRRAFFGAFGTPSGETWWFHNGPPVVEGEARTSRERLIDLHREDPLWIREVIEATPEVLGPWPLHDLAAMKRWSRGRVCLLGDAAHAMSPSAGQGASLAMEDALVLARCVRDRAEPEMAFEEFERERRPRVEPIAKAARRNSGGKTGAGPIAGWFRDRMLGFFLPRAGEAQTRSYAYRVDWVLAAK
jgi:FAD-dependent urate hydroxylase